MAGDGCWGCAGDAGAASTGVGSAFFVAAAMRFATVADVLRHGCLRRR